MKRIVQHRLSNFLSLLFIAILPSCTPKGNHHPEFEKYFAENGVTGCFEMFDLKRGEFTDYNPDRCSQRFIPASTFKIFNSLVALQTGAVPDEHTILKWDSVPRAVAAWNHDQDMEEAIRNSTVWYYQELARRIGEGKMQQYLNALHYGNRIIGGKIDSFWLNGGLRISCDEQIEFLKDFYLNNFHFSPPVVDMVKKILVLNDTAGYRISGKTGWGIMHAGETNEKAMNIGWFIGYVEKGEDVYFFATNISAPEPAPTDFGQLRIDITKRMLKDLGVIPDQ